jgi:hypothetical protein
MQFVEYTKSNSMRPVVLGSEWFGLQLRVGADRSCTMDLCYDASCYEDPKFFDS